MKAPMDLERFADLAETYGGALERWPDADRQAAAALLESSTEAQSLLRAARSLDELLHSINVDEPSPALLARVRSIPIQFEAPSLGWPFQSVWRPLFALVASLALGVLSGLGSLQIASEDPEVTAAAVTSSTSVDELSALAFGWDWEEDSEEQP